ncbi:Cys-tRNA(Pro)/Cys-tRNA(Cys) deacylase YbaK [Clostridium liquoris]|jgi:Cys-tRNA(Pro) deacylase|uniref:Cys-tRNA(Pro)/Cys-tRNA(Cys) deacylase YbaK n=1 Tax=Clostridium liquoris TaxID=1289519 RepID=A0A2T0B0P4_9CLOT|nr:YbaK/EbsC family protein [Clostridium liquoris]PRR77087.1 Cys-tRNA(Pro)/Cys-tRNA(Cys) deacylase YbaK [Clostridium liquoris]
MGIENVKKQINEKNLNLKILEFKESTATVDEAAKAVGVEPGQIAKTLAFKVKDDDILIVVKGDSKIDNRKFKDYFKTKAKMMSGEEVLEITGHPVGGVCPFGLKNPISVYLDNSLKEFESVYPAAGTPNSAVKVTIEDLEKITNGVWVDVCK